MKRIYMVLTALVVAHILALSFLKFTAWPEVLSFSYMVDKGLLIYKDFHHVYQPLLTFILFVFYKFSGISPVGLKIFTYLTIASIDFLIFAISSKIFKNNWKALIPVVMYAILQPTFEGNMLWFDIALTVPVLISVYFLFTWREFKNPKHLVLSGIFLTLGFLIKQQAILIFGPVGLYLLLEKTKFKDILKFAGGAFAPVLILLIALMATGDFADYFFWTFKFPFYWLPKTPGYQVLPIQKEWFVMILMLLIPLPAIFSSLIGKKKDLGKVLIYAILGVTMISAFPRFSFFHLQPALALFVIASSFLVTINKKLIVLATLPFIFYIGFYRWRLTMADFAGGVRFYNDEMQMAQYIDSVTKPDDKIYLLGPDSAVYVYANRIPPKPWIENYVWHFEIPGMQEKMIAGWESDPPKIIIWTPASSGNWFDLGVYQPKKITRWIQQNYTEKDRLKTGEGVWFKKNL